MNVKYAKDYIQQLTLPESKDSGILASTTS